MPHPQANRMEFDSLDESFSYLKSIQQSRRLWTILKFDTGSRYYAFYSTQTFTQKMYSVSQKIFEFSGHYGRGLPHGRELAASLTDTLVLDQRGRAHEWGGHSEEHMIQHFSDCLAQDGVGARTVIIWNSDTPCRLADRQPSSDLSGWPVSCESKLMHLATIYPGLRFQVYIRKPFGSLLGQSLSNAVGALQGSCTASNLSYHSFTTELLWQSTGLA